MRPRTPHLQPVALKPQPCRLDLRLLVVLMLLLVLQPLPALQNAEADCLRMRRVLVRLRLLDALDDGCQRRIRNNLYINILIS